MNKSFRVLDALTAITGESSRWDPQRQCLYWIDTQQPHLFCYDDKNKTSQTFKLPSPMSCIDLDLNGNLIGVMGNALVKITIDAKKAIVLLIKTNLITDNKEGEVFNDGRLDIKGNLWIGTMDKSHQHSIGKLYRISPIGEIIVMDEGFITSNGLGWSLDRTKFYFTDSITRRIYQYRFNSDTCEIDQREILIQYPEEQGYPDGLYVDKKGCLWVAGWASYHIYQYSPQGEFMNSIQLPAKNLTSCCFGGVNLKTLFVTSANSDLVDINDVGAHAGALFISN